MATIGDLSKRNDENALTPELEREFLVLLDDCVQTPSRDKYHLVEEFLSKYYYSHKLVLQEDYTMGERRPEWINKKEWEEAKEPRYKFEVDRSKVYPALQRILDELKNRLGIPSSAYK